MEARPEACAGVSLALAPVAAYGPLPAPADWSTDQPFLDSTLPGPRIGFLWKRWVTHPALSPLPSVPDECSAIPNYPLTLISTEQSSGDQAGNEGGRLPLIPCLILTADPQASVAPHMATDPSPHPRPSPLDPLGDPPSAPSGFGPASAMVASVHLERGLSLAKDVVSSEGLGLTCLCPALPACPCPPSCHL